jgi:hypothetical protein
LAEIDEIRIHLQRVRNYFEALARQPAGNYLFKRFPKGCCGNVSHILGCFLISQGYEDISYVAGERTVNDQYQTHAWLEWGGWIIDITADQFADGLSAVFMERDSEFHRSFTRNYESEPEISSCIAAQNRKFQQYMTMTGQSLDELSVKCN